METGPGHEEQDHRFRLGPSTVFGAGIGVFAQSRISEGETLEIVGVWVRADSISDRCTAFADQHKFRLGDDLLIPTGFGGMVNHSDQPNLVKWIEGKTLYLKALRTIEPGEELFHAYNEAALRRMGLTSV